MDVLSSFLGRSGLLPHGYCLTGSPGLLWSMVGADALIALTYFSIPAALVSFGRQRADFSWRGLGWLFSAFIFACGLTHLMDIWTIWRPDYGLQVLTKWVTGGVSLATAVILWRAIPLALKIPSVQQLRQAIASLEAEVARRRTAEEHLAESQESLALTLATIGAGFIATDRAGQVTRMNAVAERVTGWTHAEGQGRSLWEVFDREERPPQMRSSNPVDLMIEQALSVEQTHHVTAIARGGQRTALELRAALTHAGDGSVRGLAMVFRDLTPLMRAEAESRRLAAIVDSSVDAIVGKTLEGRITSWNRAAQALFGYSAIEAIGQSIYMLIPPDRRAEEMAILEELRHGRVVSAKDTVRLHRDGHELLVAVSISPIRDARGQVIGASKIARDVGEQRRAEKATELARVTAQRLEAENRQILEASRLKSQFLANMSHELRTPLNAVIGFADLLQSGAVPADSPKHRAYLGHIGTSGRHLLQLINDVLDLSKVESGKFEFFPEALDLPRLVQEVLDVQHNAIQRKALRLSTQIDPALQGLLLDPARLKQALYNYISNAIKFTPQGGAIVLRATPEGAHAFRLEVDDNGIGIAPADLPRLFTEFQQLDSSHSKEHPGTGLGLALTRRLVQAQGGSVGVRSTLGVGSVFHLVLPRVHGTSVLSDPAPTDEAPAQRLLVIDGRYGQQGPGEGLMRALAAAGFEADAAATGEHALRQALTHAYSAITLDLRLPDQAGLGVLERIRRQGPSRSAPVIGVSLATDELLGANFAVADVLSKPLRTDEIVQAMARLRAGLPHPARVLVIDDDPLALDLMRATLAGMGISAIGELDGRVALQALDVHRPDAIILDLMMPDFDGFAVLDALSRLAAWRVTPVYIWTSMLLNDAEMTQLLGSARAIIRKGGGTLEVLIESLRAHQLAGVPQRGGAG